MHKVCTEGRPLIYCLASKHTGLFKVTNHLKKKQLCFIDKLNFWCFSGNIKDWKLYIIVKWCYGFIFHSWFIVVDILLFADNTPCDSTSALQVLSLNSCGLVNEVFTSLEKTCQGRLLHLIEIDITANDKLSIDCLDSLSKVTSGVIHSIHSYAAEKLGAHFFQLVDNLSSIVYVPCFNPPTINKLRLNLICTVTLMALFQWFMNVSLFLPSYHHSYSYILYIFD